MSHDARAVANWLLSRGEVDQMPLDHLKLMKLVYITHGWNLGLYDRPLVRQPILGWPHGPVVWDVYVAFRGSGYDPIQTRATYYDHEYETEIPYQSTFDKLDLGVLNKVWNVYSQYTGRQLEIMTHEEGTPWSNAVAGIPQREIWNVPISNQLIAEYYRALTKTPKPEPSNVTEVQSVEAGCGPAV